MLLVILAFLGGALSLPAQAEEEFILLTVDKTTLHGELQTLPTHLGDAKMLHSFRIAIGKEEGDKFKEGDNKTPEGIYLPEQFIDTDKINPAKYGKSAISLNFPNLMDKIAGKTGYGIWLHGAGDDNRIANRQVTEGCVAFYNSDILKLAKWVTPGHSLVVIAKDRKEINQPEDYEIVQKATMDWITAWKNRDIDTYMSLYDDHFSGKGLGKTQYKAYKKSVFGSYKNMVINMSHVRVVTHPKYAISVMFQNFSGDKRFVSQGRKVLYWKKADKGGWRIFRESFDRGEFSPLSYSSADVLALKDENANKPGCCASF